MEKHIKDWEKPQLIILAKGTPEESVLLSCKTMNPNKPLEGPLASYQDTCAAGPDSANCAVCQDRGIAGGS